VGARESRGGEKRKKEMPRFRGGRVWTSQKKPDGFKMHRKGGGGPGRRSKRPSFF